MFTSIKQTKHPQLRLSCSPDGLSHHSHSVSWESRYQLVKDFWKPPSLWARTTDFFAGGGFPHRGFVVYGISDKYIISIKKYMYLLYTWEIDIIKKNKTHYIIYLYIYIFVYTNLKHLHIRNLPMKHQPAMILSPAARLHLGDVGSNLLNLQRFTVVRASGKSPSCGLGRFKKKHRALV